MSTGGVITWHAGTEISVTIQTATGPPVTAEGYHDIDRLSDHYSVGRIIRMVSYPKRFLAARQERTEVVTRAGLVFSMRRGLFLLQSRRR